jgi:hypothetical protein
MKNLFTKSLALIALLFSCALFTLPSQASTYTVITTNLSGNIVTNGGLLSSITINNTNATAALVYFYDSGNTNFIQTNGAYTNYITSFVTYTNIYTNYFGVLTTNSYAVKSNSVNNVAAGSITNFLIDAMYCGPSNVVSHNFVGPSSSLGMTVVNGIMYTNNTPNQGLIYTINYGLFH